MQSQGIKREPSSIFEDSYSDKIEPVSLQRPSVQPSSSFNMTTVTTPVKKCMPSRRHNSFKFGLEDFKVSDCLQEEPEDEYDHIETESTNGDV